MARTLPEIIASMEAKWNSYPDLAAMTTTPSAVANWRSFVEAHAISQLAFEQQLDLLKAQINAAVDSSVPGIAEWYQRRMLAFQYGSQIRIMPDLQVKYDLDKPEQRIIKRVSVKENVTGDKVVIKIAKADGPLTSPEFAAANSYLDKIAFVGIGRRLVSLYPDRLQTFLKVYFDGQFVEADVKTSAIEALKQFLANLTFDGVILASALVDALQKVAGVVDVEVVRLKGRSEQTVATSPAIQPFNRFYETVAGYCILEDFAGLTPAETIEMIVAR